MLGYQWSHLVEFRPIYNPKKQKTKQNTKACKYVQGAGKQVHDHCNHWIDTTQSIQWTSVTPPNLGGGKNEALGVKTTAGTRGTAKTRWAARGAPAVTPSTDEILPLPIRRTAEFDKNESTIVTTDGLCDLNKAFVVWIKHATSFYRF